MSLLLEELGENEMIYAQFHVLVFILTIHIIKTKRLARVGSTQITETWTSVTLLLALLL
jgi:hypothetical protein